MRIKKLWFTDERMFIETGHEQTLSVALSRFPRLQRANARQRAAWTQVCDGLRWDEIDEDISLESFGYADNDPQVFRWQAPTTI
jgi:hypothetical protein